MLVAVWGAVAGCSDEGASSPLVETTTTTIQTLEDRAAEVALASCIAPVPVTAVLADVIDQSSQSGFITWYFDMVTETGYSYGVVTVQYHPTDFAPLNLPNGDMNVEC